MIRYLLSFSLLSLFLAGSALAQDINLRRSDSPFNSLYTLEPENYTAALVNIALGLAGIVAFIFMLIGGLQWITAGGDKDAIEKARRKIIESVIGLSVVFSIYVIILIIETLFSVNIRTFEIPQI